MQNWKIEIDEWTSDDERQLAETLHELNLLLSYAYAGGVDYHPSVDRALIPGNNRPPPIKVKLARITPEAE